MRVVRDCATYNAGSRFPQYFDHYFYVGAIGKKGPYIDRVPLMFVRDRLKIRIAPNLATMI